MTVLTGPGPTDEHSVHTQHRDFIVTLIADQIGPIYSVSKTEYYDLKNHFSEPQCKMTVLPLNSGKPRTCVTLNGSGIQLAVGPQPLWLRNHNSELAHRIMVKRLATSPHDPLGITDSACKNQLVVVSLQYGPFNPYIPIRSTIIGKSRVAKDTIAMHTSWRSNSDIASVTRPKNLKFHNRSKRARHRKSARKLHGLPGTGPNQTLERIQPSRHDIFGSSPEHRRSGGRPAAAPPPRRTRGGNAHDVARRARNVRRPRRRIIVPSPRNSSAASAVRPATVARRLQQASSVVVRERRSSSAIARSRRAEWSGARRAT
ncbi:isoflavone 3'-hydroxylase-like [Dorcoceras hygrometricum]|uniref:Isoflavone 3'-hydroxylase-like n=1 Tax=Dorcoceras hygrometricum TaxID=472368 RepID=A0A2Z7B2Q6_9LAMI|nr:isoflavone 3'-hydroxylase-like [Dorcoceras hygrometricum]